MIRGRVSERVAQVLKQVIERRYPVNEPEDFPVIIPPRCESVLSDLDQVCSTHRRRKTTPIRLKYGEMEHSSPDRDITCGRWSRDASKSCHHTEEDLIDADQCQKLIQAVLLHGIRSALSGCREDMDWIFSSEDGDEDKPMSFLWCCAALSTDPSRIRNSVVSELQGDRRGRLPRVGTTF